MSEYMGDLTGILGASATNRTPTHNTHKTSVDMDMTDFLTLMVAQLQYQSIDETADTSQMLNQMVQMQMISALTNMTEASIMSYASSLVGKEVTVVTYDGSKAEEKVIEVVGTGTYGGEQVIFSKEGDMYYLNEVMAVGRMPEQKTDETDKPEGDKPTDPADKPTDPADKPTDPADKPTYPTDKPTYPTDKPTDPADKPVEDTQGSGGVTDKPEAGEDNGADKPVENTPETPEGELPADRPVENPQEGEAAEPAGDETSKVEGVDGSAGAAEGED